MGHKRMRRGRRLLSAVAFGLFAVGGTAVSGCDTWAFVGGCACSLEFRYYTTTVVDSDGVPVTDADIVVTRVRDGHTLSVSQDFGGQNGVYVILDDGHRDAVQAAGERIRVVITSGGVSVTGNYFFTKDDCGCHLELVQGPETLELGAKRSL